MSFHLMPDTTPHPREKLPGQPACSSTIASWPQHSSLQTAESDKRWKEDAKQDTGADSATCAAPTPVPELGMNSEAGFSQKPGVVGSILPVSQPRSLKLRHMETFCPAHPARKW